MTEARNATLDQMIEFAMEALLSGDGPRKRAMVRRMAERWPREPALALAFAVTSAAEAIEDIEEVRGAGPGGGPAGGPGGARDPAVPLGYRLSALISADVHAVQSMGQVPSVAGDLLHFWRRVDPLFLRLQ